jgi:predicted GNAT family acetyltransferase
MEGRATFLPFRDTMEGSVFNERELAVPGILAELMNAFTAPARSMTDPTFNAGEEAANMAMNVGGSGLAISRGMRAPTGQGGFDLAMNAYHGTPYDIKGGFDLSKIGTGEGAQAYGYGTYFSKNPEIAGKYTGSDEIQILANGQVTDSPVAKQILRYGGDPNAYIKAMEKLVKNQTDALQKASKEELMPGFSEYEIAKSDLTSTLKNIEEAKSIKSVKTQPVGNMYKVDIPDEQIPRMLDWNKPIAQQNKEILDILKNEPAILADLANGKSLDKLTGEQAYQAIASTFDVGQADAYKLASEYLNRIGIPGIRYLDPGSRGVGKGAENFVSFDPATVKILEKNDIPVPNFDVVKTNASEIFGKGAERVRYTDPKSGGFIDVLSKPDGTASVMGLEVPKEFRGTGIGKELQSKVLSDFPVMGGQVSSKAAATNAYKLGRRPVGKPNATLEDVLKTIDEDSSVNLVSTQMQKMFTE